MQRCYDERVRLKKSDHLIEAEAIKLAMNSIYGKLIQNVEGYRSTGVHTSCQSWLMALEGCRMTDLDVVSAGKEFLGLVHYPARLTFRKVPSKWVGGYLNCTDFKCSETITWP